VIGLLSIAIVVLMLGSPATLLHPTDSSDGFSASLLEGLTLPQFVYVHLKLPNFRMLRSLLFTRELPILPTSLFRPPSA
jgi:hypothetical protein